MPDMETFGSASCDVCRRELLGYFATSWRCMAPLSHGSLAHSGMFQNNTMMLNVGFNGLSEVFKADVAREFHAREDTL